jgi:RNA polymerase sigma-32 factor
LVEAQEVSEHNSQELSMALSSLDDRSKDIIARRYLADEKETLHDLADEYNVSAERIRQIENGALKKLKAAMSNAA